MTARVVIVGSGFGGLYAVRALAKSSVSITLVDRQNYHLFQPLLYQVATAGLSPGDIASPIRGLVGRNSNVSVHMGTVTRVDLKAKRVHLADEVVDYDQLILAPGVSHSYFGHGEWEPFAPGLKTLDDALEIRRRVLLAFEEAEREADPVARAAWLNFVVVGAGPTGVELAGAVAELARFTVAGEFRHFDPTKANVVLVEAGPRVLSAFDERLSEKALKSLRKLGVDVRLDTRVTQIGAERVTLQSGAPQSGAPQSYGLLARTVLWAAGVEASPLAKSLGVELDRSGRVKVQNDLTIPGYPEVSVIGDLASFDTGDGHTLPGLAPVAIQQGRHAAKNVLAVLAGKPRTEFRYRDKGTMATVGRAVGVAQTGRLQLSGFLGWLAWLFVHILYLIGFRNRLLVMIQWAWAFLTYGRSARLITGTTPVPSRPSGPKVEAPAA